MTAGSFRVAAVLSAIAMVLAACTSEPAREALARAPATSSTTSSTTTTTTSTTTSTTTTTLVPVEEPPLPGMGEGDVGEAVATLEQRLDALRYDVGALDGTYDAVTAHAVIAFQKVHGLERTGRATDDVMAVLAGDGGHYPALAPAGGPDRVEVDLARQVLFLYQHGALHRILPVSTGSGERFCSQGWCRRAVTPRGAYSVYRVGRGWEYGPLGGLYNPLYFNGGIAVHGAWSVPGYPASHGCVRIPMNAAEWFPTIVGNGWPVFVASGPHDVVAPLAPEPAPAPEPVPAPATEVVDTPFAEPVQAPVPEPAPPAVDPTHAAGTDPAVTVTLPPALPPG